MKLNEIYVEDCVSFMRRLEEEREQPFDVIVSSPPYNLKKPYSKYKDDKKRTEFLAWMAEVAEVSKSVLKDDGSFFLNFGGKPTDPWMAWEVAREFGRPYVLQNVFHWIKHISIPKDMQAKAYDMNGDQSFGHFKPINSPFYLNQGQEYIFHFTKNGNVPLDKLAIGVPYQDKSNVKRWKREDEGGKHRDKRDRGNVWFIRYPTKVGSVKKVLHPAEFPAKLPYLCIKLHGIKKDMVVYDPFMGIGNTALACKTLGVDYVGTEIDPRYVEVANRELSQLELAPRTKG